MSATRRHSAEPARGGSDAAVRGALLIGVAVIVGLLLLWRGHDDDSSATVSTGAGDTPGVTTAPGDTTPGGTTAPTDTTVPPPTTHKPADVQVLVANGTGTSGGAANVTARLMPGGWGTLPAVNANATNIAASVVYFREGYEEDAKQVARTLGVPEETVAGIVAPMPEPPPVAATEKAAQTAANAKVLVVLGKDEVIKQ